MSFTTLIPAFKPEYLVQQLTCLRRQKLKPERIIFSDDSPNNAFIKLLTQDPIKTKIADLKIEVIEGPKKGATKNTQQLIDVYLSRGVGSSQYFHILMDDDLIYPTFYEQHLKAHARYEPNCVVSRRWLTVDDSDPAKDVPLPETIADGNEIFREINGKELFMLTVGRGTNWLGEFSNASFSRTMAIELKESSFDEIRYDGLEDLGAFLRAADSNPLVLINMHLGIFRKNNGNNSSNPRTQAFKRALLAWFALAIIGKRSGKLAESDYIYALAHRKANLIDHCQRSYQDQGDMIEMLKVICSKSLQSESFETSFLDNWNKFLING